MHVKSTGKILVENEIIFDCFIPRRANFLQRYYNKVSPCQFGLVYTLLNCYKLKCVTCTLLIYGTLKFEVNG